MKTAQFTRSLLYIPKMACLILKELSPCKELPVIWLQNKVGGLLVDADTFHFS